MNKAVFLDRDGVINELVYHHEQEVIDSPFTVEQLKLIRGVPEAIKLLRQAGYLIVLVSNQPGIGKGHMSSDIFEMIRKRMRSDLGKVNAELDGEYYCFHHPEAILEQFKIDCDCRKPRPGLLLRAATEMDIDLSQSWIIGDNLSDVQAGKTAGCQTILLGRMKCELCNLMHDRDVVPSTICVTLLEAAQYVLKTRLL